MNSTLKTSGLVLAAVAATHMVDSVNDPRITAKQFFGPRDFYISADNYESRETNEVTGQVIIMQIPRKAVKE